MRRGVALGVVVALVLALVIGGLAAVLGLGNSSDSTSDGTSSTVAGPTAPTTTTTRAEFSGADSEAYCAANVRLNQELVANAPTSNDPAASEMFYDQRVAVFRQLEQVAPAEIKADLSLIVAAFDALRPVLVAANWDESQVSDADLAAIQTPEVTLAFQRSAQYDERFCEIATQG